MTEVLIVFPFPPSANTAYPTNTRGGRHLSKKGQAYKQAARGDALAALHGLVVNDSTKIGLNFLLHFPSKRKADIDNYIKIVKDVICETLRIDDDYSRVPVVHVEFGGIDPKSPRCEARVTFL